MRTNKKARGRPPAKRTIHRNAKKASTRNYSRLAVVEQQLQLSQEQLDLAVAGAGLGLWHYSVASGRLSWSQRCSDIFGIRADVPLTYEQFLKMVHPDDRPQIDQRFAESLTGRKDYAAEFRIRRQDGLIRWIAARGRAHYDEAGNPVRIEGVARDVSERTLAVEKLQRNLDRIKALREIEKAITSTLELDRILDLLLEKIDVSGRYAAATVRLVNHKTGLLELLAAKNIDVDKWKQGFSAAPGGLSQVVLSSKVPVRVLEIQRDPRTRHRDFLRGHGLVSFLGLPLITKNEALGVLAVFTAEPHVFDDDEVEFLTTIAGRAAIAIDNAQLYEETARANKVKEQFLSVMSHELRTPLSVVMGYTGMLMERMLGDINPQQEEALQKVLTRAAEQLHLVNTMIQTTQLESRALLVERHPVPLSELLNHVRDEMEAICKGKDLQLVWNCPKEPIIVVTDTSKVIQILRNLIGNAIKFTHSGRVTISAKLNKGERAVNGSNGSSSEKASPRIEFQVTDTGVGMTAEQCKQIFDKFYQVDSSETRLYGGLGLGLYVVKNLTDMLGGEIAVESEPGTGSTFSLSIPCHQALDTALARFESRRSD
jgi:PAS domain S-box-containing protein